MPSYAEIQALVDQIRDAKPEALDPIVAGWTSAATTASDLTTRAATIDRDTAAAFTNNAHEVYDAATNTARTRTALGDGGEHFDRIGRAVGVVREELATTKTGVMKAWNQLTAELNAVNDGYDRLSHTAHSLTQTQVDAQTAVLKGREDSALSTHGSTITRLMGNYDDILNNRRGTLAGLGFTGQPTPASAGTAALLPVGGSAAQVTAAWESLDPKQQADLLETNPALLGNLDGIPASIRDLANRDRLPGEMTSLDGQIAAAQTALNNSLHSAGTGIPGRKGETQGDTPEQAKLRANLAQLQQKRDALTAINDTIGQRDRQLLSFDTSGRHVTAAVAVGNIDTADHVAVFTPGLDTTVEGGGLRDSDKAAADLRTEAQNATYRDHSGTVATVAWLGYQAPRTNGELVEPGHSVFTEGDAQAGSTQLAHFLDGVRSSHDGDVHITAMGHSYGSLTTGLALQKTNAANDAIFFGSPGIGTNHVSDLHVPAGHTYAAAAENDWVADSSWFSTDPTRLDGVTTLSTAAAARPDTHTPLAADNGHTATGGAPDAYLTGNTTAQYNFANVIAGAQPDKLVIGHHSATPVDVLGGIQTGTVDLLTGTVDPPP